MKVDIAVVGGGPAGSSTALRLAQMGYEVALFDRASFPRNKPCGEFLNPEAARILRAELGIDLPSDAAPVSRISLIPERGPSLTVPLLDELGVPALGYSLRRIRTDSILIESARRGGVQIFEGSQVRNVSATGVTGTNRDAEPFECRARMIVACDGSHSVIARQRGLVRPIRRLQRIGVVAHYSGAEFAQPELTQMWSARRRSWGVAGFTAQANGQAVLSAAVPIEAGRALSADREGFIRGMVSTLRGLAESLEGATLDRVCTAPSFGHRLSRPFDDGLLFVGDAVHFVDPFTGEGVHHALAGALLACDTIQIAFDRGDVSSTFLAHYGAARRELKRRYVACDLVQKLVNTPWLIEWAARNLSARPEVAEILFGALIDSLPPKTVWSSKVVAGALVPSFE